MEKKEFWLKQKRRFITSSNTKKFIVEHITLYTIILVFLGYWNLHSYYTMFGIDIYNYVNTTEILLSFLPIIIKLMIIILMISPSFILLAIITSIINSKMFNKTKSEFLINKKRLTELHKLYKTANTEEKLKILEEINEIDIKNTPLLKKNLPVYYVLSFVIIGLTVYLFIKYSNNEYPYIYSAFSYLMMSGLYSYVTYRMHLRVFKQVRMITKIDLLKISLVISFFIFSFILYYENLIEANLILANKPNYIFSFNLQDKKYISDTTSVYVGETKDYLVIRNNYTGFNTILKKEKLENFNIRKIKSDSFWDDLICNNKIFRRK